MEDFKQILKDVLNKFSDKKDILYPSIRMSDINNSLSSDILPPLHCSTFKSNNENDALIFNTERMSPKYEKLSPQLNNNFNSETNLEKLNNNNLIKSRNPSDVDENKNKLLKLKITDNNDPRTSPVVNVRNNLTKEERAIEKNITEMISIAKTKDPPSPNTHKQKPIMGRAALLKRTSLDRNDSRIVHDLINTRYNEVLNHYYSRMYRRRKSKVDSSEEEYSDSVFSTPPNWSPVSGSSVDNPYFPETDRKKDLRFLKSTDDANIDTTIEDFDTMSLNSSAISCGKSTTSVSDYDPKKFLENAIGDMAQGTSASRESGIVNDDEIKETNSKEDFSVGPSDISSLLSRANCLYSSIKKSIGRSSMRRKATSQSENNAKDFRHSIASVESCSDSSLLDKLMRELSIQNEILFQVSKALNYCRTTKGFETSIEFIEAEKILLLASCTKTALTKEIENVEDETYEQPDDSRSCGQVNLSNLKFFTKLEFRSITHRDMTDQFVVILSCGSTVLASEVTAADENGVVSIEKCFQFKKLPTDFEISICIYSMRVPNKPHIQENSNCPSPKKFFLNKMSKKYRVINETLYIKASSFLPCGKCEIRNPNLSRMSSNNEENSSITLKMYNMPLSTSLSDTFSMDISSEVKFNNKMSGFLTLGLDNEHGYTVWNIRWCVLEGSILKYWNHPSEEVNSELGSIDLKYCLEKEISPVDRSLCARPRTLMVSVKHKDTERKIFMSANSVSDMKQWETELNYILRLLSTWNCGGAKIP